MVDPVHVTPLFSLNYPNIVVPFNGGLKSFAVLLHLLHQKNGMIPLLVYVDNYGIVRKQRVTKIVRSLLDQHGNSLYSRCLSGKISWNLEIVPWNKKESLTQEKLEDICRTIGFQRNISSFCFSLNEKIQSFTNVCYILEHSKVGNLHTPSFQSFYDENPNQGIWDLLFPCDCSDHEYEENRKENEPLLEGCCDNCFPCKKLLSQYASFYGLDYDKKMYPERNEPNLKRIKC